MAKNNATLLANGNSNHVGSGGTTDSGVVARVGRDWIPYQRYLTEPALSLST